MDELLAQLDAVRSKYITNRIAPKRDWYRIENAAGADAAEIYVYDEIGWFGTTAQDFINQLQDLDAATINLHLNSPGGSVFDGFAIYSALRQHDATVNVTIDSLAASIASVIAMAGDTVAITPVGQMMIHDGIGLAVGNAEEHRELADLLDKLSDTIAGVYAERTGSLAARAKDRWRRAMKAETWYNADEALAAGLVDRIDRPTRKTDNTATADFDISVFTGESGTTIYAASSDEDAGTDVSPNGDEPTPNGETTNHYEWDPASLRAAIKEAMSP